MTEPPDNAIDLLREWLKEWDAFLESDERLVIPDVWPQHLDALEKVLDVAEAGDNMFSPKRMEYRIGGFNTPYLVAKFREAVKEMRRG